MLFLELDIIAQARIERSKAGTLEDPNPARTQEFEVIVENRRALIRLYGTLPVLEYLKECINLKERKPMIFLTFFRIFHLALIVDLFSQSIDFLQTRAKGVYKNISQGCTKI